MRKIEITEYDPVWPERFESEKKRLMDILGSTVTKVHHIGSTAVHGLAAKPIIDILIEVNNLAALDAHNSEMEKNGYKVKGEFGIPGRRYFQKGGNNRTHQVHAFECRDDNIERHIAFRDYLRLNPDVASEYAVLKKSVVEQCSNDIDKYCTGKDAFVKHHEKIAMRLNAPNKHIYLTANRT